MEMSQTIGKLAEALSKAQAALKPAKKSAVNPFFNSHYATLEEVLDVVRKPLAENGLSFVQVAESNAEGISVNTRLLHISGEWIGGAITTKPVKNDPQGAGSALTYLRRYGLSSIIGVATEDDDGNAASEEKDAPKANKRSSGGKTERASDPNTFFEFKDKNGAQRIGVVPGDIYTPEAMKNLGLQEYQGKYYPKQNAGREGIEAIKSFLVDLVAASK